MDMDRVAADLRTALLELVEESSLEPGDLVVIGCSTSEVQGLRIGKHSEPDIGTRLIAEVAPLLEEKELFLATQCCEHLNRALVVDAAYARRERLEEVTVMPQPKAGGSFSTAYYRYLENPVMVEHVQARAGLDIGDTLIGMHIKHVAVPVRLSVKKIGEAHLTAARSRPKLVGGERACYE